jgi:predicted transcriptional regulator
MGAKAGSLSRCSGSAGDGFRDDVASRYPEKAMATAKRDVRKILDALPEEASLEDIQYHLYVIQHVERGREDVEAGRVVPQNEVEQRLSRLL